VYLSVGLKFVEGDVMEVIIIIAIHLRITSFNLRDGFQFIFGKMTDREGMLLEARREWGYTRTDWVIYLILKKDQDIEIFDYVSFLTG